MSANTCAVPLLTGSGERRCSARKRARQRGAAPRRTGAASIEVPTHHRWYALIPKQCLALGVLRAILEDNIFFQEDDNRFLLQNKIGELISNCTHVWDKLLNY